MSHSFGQHITIGEKTMSFSVKFHLSRKLANGSHTVLVFISGYEKAKRLRISTDVSIANEKHFDTKKRAINAKDSFAELKNERLKFIEYNILVTWYDIQKEYKKAEQLPTTAEVESKLRAAAAKIETQKATFFDELSKYTETKKNYQTKKSYEALANALKDFKPSWSWNDCTDKGINNFTEHLLTVKKFTNGTANIRVVSLRAFLNAMIENKIIADKSYKKTEVPEVKEKTRYLLTKEELVQYSQFNYENKRQSLAQNLFLFATLTAQRVSDAWRVKPENIVNNIWYITQQKTNVDLEIPLIDKALEILEKTNYFAELKRIANKGKAKFIEPHKNFNKELKATFLLFGLTDNVETNKGTKQRCETIGFHDARALFATLCQAHGYNDSLAAAVTGHKMKGVLKTYQKTSNETKLKMLQDIFQGL